MLSFISIISSLSLKKHIAIVDKKSIRTQNYFEFKPWKQESTLNQAKNKFSIEGWSTLSETYDQNGDQQVQNEISTSLFPHCKPPSAFLDSFSIYTSKCLKKSFWKIFWQVLSIVFCAEYSTIYVFICYEK